MKGAGLYFQSSPSSRSLEHKAQNSMEIKLRMPLTNSYFSGLWRCGGVYGPIETLKAAREFSFLSWTFCHGRLNMLHYVGDKGWVLYFDALLSLQFPLHSADTWHSEAHHHGQIRLFTQNIFTRLEYFYRLSYTILNKSP